MFQRKAVFMPVDLRSDTVTHPSPAMREAMYRAEVGDDVYSEDPTVNRLQELAAGLLGKEAALFVPSGTMGNVAAVMTHAERGQSVIVGDQSHIYCFEGGAASTLGGAPMFVVPTNADGTFDLARVKATIADDSDEHVAPTALLCIENTHNYCGGTVLNITQVTELADLAHEHRLAIHMDGARIFNASIALGLPVADLARPVDSVMFCLSKGLSAPVGSLLVGKRNFIHRAKRIRKLLGGGMRQAGVLAAAGIVALEQMVERLAEDHVNCKQLALGLADYPQIEIDAQRVVTNILVFRVQHSSGAPASIAETERFLTLADEQGVQMGHMGGGRIRAVTHYGIEAQHITEALAGIRRALISLQL
jgi:threonine aldolase